jgi:hypothetical protein
VFLHLCFEKDLLIGYTTSDSTSNIFCIFFSVCCIDVIDLLVSLSNAKCRKQIKISMNTIVVEYERIDEWRRCCKKSLDIINGAIRWLLGTLGSVASLLAATLYQGNHDRNFGSTERCTLYAGAAAVMICEAPYDKTPTFKSVFYCIRLLCTFIQPLKHSFHKI